MRCSTACRGASSARTAPDGAPSPRASARAGHVLLRRGGRRRLERRPMPAGRGRRSSIAVPLRSALWPLRSSDPKTIYVGTGQVTSRYDIAAGEGSSSRKTAARAGRRSDSRDAPHRRDRRRSAQRRRRARRRPRPRVRAEPGARRVPLRRRRRHAGRGRCSSARTPAPSIWRSTRRRLTSCSPRSGRCVTSRGSATSRRARARRAGCTARADGGRTFDARDRLGLAGAKLGRIESRRARICAGTTRVYAAVEGGDAGGLYRSDDAGAGLEARQRRPEPGQQLLRPRDGLAQRPRHRVRDGAVDPAAARRVDRRARSSRALPAATTTTTSGSIRRDPSA